MASKLDHILSSQEDKQDITRNLPSLTFETALDEEELMLLHLRQQSHAHTVQICASSAFLINVLNETRQIRADLAKTSKQRRAIQLLTADSLPKDPIKVGILGCGRLGTHIAQSMLTFGEISASDLSISTRRPETLGHLKDKGVNVGFNNKAISSKVHVLFLCVLPSQLSSVIEEIKDHLHKQQLVYCMVNNASAKKFRRTLDTTNFIIPNFVFKPETANKWNSCMSIQGALEDSEVVRKCCPLSAESQESCVHLTDKWVELMICAFVNHCTDLEMMSDTALDMLHGICIGMENFEKGDASRFTQTDFIINWKTNDQEPRKFPKFDLAKIHDNDSNVVKKLRSSPYLTKCFMNKFSAVYQNYHNMRRYQMETE